MPAVLRRSTLWDKGTRLPEVLIFIAFLAMARNAFVEALGAAIPPEPADMERILAFNRGESAGVPPA
jgi:hypothetical protein